MVGWSWILKIMFFFVCFCNHVRKVLLMAKHIKVSGEKAKIFNNTIIMLKSFKVQYNKMIPSLY